MDLRSFHQFACHELEDSAPPFDPAWGHCLFLGATSRLSTPNCSALTDGIRFSLPKLVAFMTRMCMGHCNMEVIIVNFTELSISCSQHTLDAAARFNSRDHVQHWNAALCPGPSSGLQFCKLKRFCAVRKSVGILLTTMSSHAAIAQTDTIRNLGTALQTEHSTIVMPDPNWIGSSLVASCFLIQDPVTFLGPPMWQGVLPEKNKTMTNQIRAIQTAGQTTRQEHRAKTKEQPLGVPF